MKLEVAEVMEMEVADHLRILRSVHRKQRCAPHIRLANAIRGASEARDNNDVLALDGHLDEVMHAAAAWRAGLGIRRP